MRLEIQKISEFSFRELLPSLKRYSKLAFAAMFFIAIGSGMFIWYRNVYQGEWSDDVKRQYAETTFRETTFREESFRAAIDSIFRRAESYKTDVTVKNDIFTPLPVPKVNPVSAGR